MFCIDVSYNHQKSVKEQTEQVKPNTQISDWGGKGVILAIKGEMKYGGWLHLQTEGEWSRPASSQWDKFQSYLSSRTETTYVQSLTVLWWHGGPLWVWSTVSNAALRSRRIRREGNLTPAAISRSFTTLYRAVFSAVCWTKTWLRNRNNNNW